jgi:LacI family transcriptional regulator
MKTPRSDGFSRKLFVSKDSLQQPLAREPVSPQKARVTQLDIARAARVHNTTVSLALRNSPSIPEETRFRIQALAIKLGYSPDPALRALVAYRNGRAINRRVETIAYITQGRTREDWRECPAEAACYTAARQKAEDCGYRLEPFWLGEPGLSDLRLASMLFHRGIAGVILASLLSPPPRMPGFDWRRFSAIKLGGTPSDPPTHRVTIDATGSIRLALRHAVNAGYRRAGLVLSKCWDDALDQGWSAGFSLGQPWLRHDQHMPIFFGQHATSSAPSDYASEETERFALWLDKFQPDVILSGHPSTAQTLASLGIETRHDVGLIDLLGDAGGKAVAAINQNLGRLGQIAVEMLIAQLQQNLRGLPAVPTTTLVSGSWNPGPSWRAYRERDTGPVVADALEKSPARTETAA